MPGFFCISMPDIYRRQNAPGGVQIDKTRPRPEPGKKIKPHKPRGKCTLLRAGGAEQAPRETGAYCVSPSPIPPPRIYITGWKREQYPRACAKRSDASERKNDHRGRPRLDNLNAALNTWNEKLAEIWQLLTQGLADFKGGGVWTVMLNVHSAMTAIGLGLLVLFFAVGVVKTCGSFAEARRPEYALKLFVRFVLAKAAVQYGLELMLAVFDIVQGIVSRAMSAAGIAGSAAKNNA